MNSLFKKKSLVQPFVVLALASMIQLAVAIYLFQIVPVVVVIGLTAGLVLSYLMGTYGLMASGLGWVTFLFIKYPEVLMAIPSLMLASSVIFCWWLATFCKKNYSHYVNELEEGLIRTKETTLILQQKLAQIGLGVKKQKEDYEKQLLDLESTVEDLKQQLSAHRHHLSIAWQETHHVKEELDKQKKDSQTSLDYLHRQCMYHMQSKNHAESMLDKIKADLQQKLYSQKENYLTIISSLEERLSFAQIECQDKESQLELLKEKLASIQMLYAFGDAQVEELDWNS
jgi:hypothetical protein